MSRHPKDYLTKSDWGIFLKWVETHGNQFEEIFNKLDELTTMIHEKDDSRPFEANLEIIMNGLEGCIDVSRSQEDDNERVH